MQVPNLETSRQASEIVSGNSTIDVAVVELGDFEDGQFEQVVPHEWMKAYPAISTTILLFSTIDEQGVSWLDMYSALFKHDEHVFN